MLSKGSPPNRFTLSGFTILAHGFAHWYKVSFENTSLKNVAIGAGCKNVLECSGEETANVLSRAIEDQSNSYVIISKIKPGNTSTIPNKFSVDCSPLNP